MLEEIEAMTPIERDIDLEIRLEKIEDLSDFCQLWGELRPELQKQRDDQGPPDRVREETVRWLSLLADRVCAGQQF